MVSLRISVALAAVLGLACSDGPLVVLGDRAAPRYRFDPPEVVTKLSVPKKTDNPTLTADMLDDLLHVRARPLPGRHLRRRALRSKQALRSRAARRCRERTGVETSPAVSADGLTLWFASDRAGGEGDLDIWVASRATRSAKWSEPSESHDAQLGRERDPAPARPARARDADGLRPLRRPATTRSSSPRAATRLQRSMRPSRCPSSSFPEQSTVDGFLSDDGLTLFYVSGPEFGAADLYVASRRSTDDPFEHERRSMT